LKQFDAKACFFVIGRKVREHPQLARDIVAQGHELANHTDSHRERWFWSELWRGVGREIDSCSAAITETTGQRPRWFRSPVGMNNPYVAPVVRNRGMRTLGWSANARDAGGDGADVATCVARVLDGVRPGSILVLHPEWCAPDGEPHGLTCLEIVLQGLKERGFRCVLPAGQHTPCEEVR
jgi:peptidoglycan/xylan/chitin deacetylase (PgdA/CDA1 family)